MTLLVNYSGKITDWDPLPPVLRINGPVTVDSGNSCQSRINPEGGAPVPLTCKNHPHLPCEFRPGSSTESFLVLRIFPGNLFMNFQIDRQGS